VRMMPGVFVSGPSSSPLMRHFFSLLLRLDSFVIWRARLHAQPRYHARSLNAREALDLLLLDYGVNDLSSCPKPGTLGRLLAQVSSRWHL